MRKKIFFRLTVFFAILFVAGLLMELPMAVFVWYQGHDTFMATLDVDHQIMAYKFLPIVLTGEKQILSMYILYIPFPTVLSLLGYIVFQNKYNKEY